MDQIAQALSNVDQKVWIIIGIILVILFIISLIKKAVKLGILIAVILAINTFIIPVVNQYQEKYNFRIEDNVAMFTVNGKDISIDKETCQGIKFNGKNDTSGEYGISIIVDGETIEFEAPKFIQTGIQKFADISGINVDK